MKLKTASFCPHCGHIEKEHWWDRIRDRFQGDGSTSGARPTQAALVSTLMGLAIASYFLYTAIQKESIQSLILAVLTFIFVLRSWFAARKRKEDSESDESTTTHVFDAEEILENKFYCENCGARVDQDADQCPKCGMKFG
ncbi:MAG: hypothetical protein HYW57_02695 [Ignavibacteriales bacterium]|nr:hypothetical protein [Ignavibacteriales bacterium]